MFVSHAITEDFFCYTSYTTHEDSSILQATQGHLVSLLFVILYETYSSTTVDTENKFPVINDSLMKSDTSLWISSCFENGTPS